jgi:hypothetical protein
MSDTSEAPALELEPDPTPKPPPIDPTPVDGAADLPDDVKNGEIPGEDDPAIAALPVTTDE